MKLSDIDINNAEFQNALKLIQFTNRSVFLTGKAGTGKSTFLKYICSVTNKKYVVVAPTGIAAINVGGQTLHSFFKIPFRPILPNDPDLSTEKGRIYDFLKYRKQHVKLIKELELLVIDEVSMLRVDILDFVDRVLRVFSDKKNVPFGGKQLLMIGDVFQLEPVVPRDEWSILSRFYNTPFFFSARVFSSFPMVQIELRKVYRQKNPEFISLLDKIRVNKAKTYDIDKINNQYNPDFRTEGNELFITLATRRNTVDYINEQRLNDLKTESFIFKGIINGEFANSSLPTTQELELKEGAQVMFVKNDTEKRWYNGSLGTVSDISEDYIYVTLEDETEHYVEKEIWQNIRYSYDEKNNKIIEEEIGSYTQYPLKLAWAITVHKSQGLTFDNVMIDFSGGAFAGGQLYVALSRCTSLEGIVLKNPISQRDVIVKKECVNFSRNSNNNLQIQESLNSAYADDLYSKSLKAFKKNDFIKAVSLFNDAQIKRNDLPNKVIQRYVASKFNIINKLNKKIKKLESKERKTQKLMNEYFLLSHECISLANNRKAAIANLNKAIKLKPDYFDALFKRAGLHVENKDYELAEKDYSKTVKLKPRTFKVYYNRGRNRMLLKDYNGAYKDLKKAIKIKDDHYDAYFYLSEVCYRLGDDQEGELYKNISENL